MHELDLCRKMLAHKNKAHFFIFLCLLLDSANEIIYLKSVYLSSSFKFGYEN